MRAPVDTIPAPPIPDDLEWVNVAMLRLDQQRGRPVLFEFWDFCRAHSLRTLPYVQGWHERYAEAGLRVISVHCGGYPPSQDAGEIRAAVARLGILHPVLLDPDFRQWRLFGNQGWPGRYLFNQQLRLHSYHYGEGAYEETGADIAELLGVAAEPFVALRPEDATGAPLVEHSAEQEGAWSGPYEAGGVWAVVSGAGTLTVNGEAVAVEHAGCLELIAHDRHTAAVLELEPGPGVTVHAVQFTPGLAP